MADYEYMNHHTDNAIAYLRMAAQKPNDERAQHLTRALRHVLMELKRVAKKKGQG